MAEHSQDRPPLNSYQVYLTEFRRTDFDAELYAAKTRKLIRECAKLKSFLGHLPEIAIDERYLENLRFSRMSSADKAEKIIRDIETVIRREEARNQASIADGNRSWDQTAVTRKALEIWCSFPAPIMRTQSFRG